METLPLITLNIGAPRPVRQRTSLGAHVLRPLASSEHSRSPSYSRIELGLRTKYCAFWSGRTGIAMVEIYSLSRLVTEYLVINRYTSREFDS